jgi:hypothetical protein
MASRMGPVVTTFLAIGIVFIIIIAIALYIYIALVWSTIAKKLGYDKPWLAWIPIANLFLLPILAKKHWAWGFIFLVPIVNIVFFIIWTWNIFEQRKYPGWLSLVPIAAMMPSTAVVAGIAWLVILGIVAWVDKK